MYQLKTRFSEDLQKEKIIEKQHNKGKGIVQIHAQRGNICIQKKFINL